MAHDSSAHALTLENVSSSVASKFSDLFETFSQDRLVLVMQTRFVLSSALDEPTINEDVFMSLLNQSPLPSIFSWIVVSPPPPSPPSSEDLLHAEAVWCLCLFVEGYARLFPTKSLHDMPHRLTSLLCSALKKGPTFVLPDEAKMHIVSCFMTIAGLSATHRTELIDMKVLDSILSILSSASTSGDVAGAGAAPSPAAGDNPPLFLVRMVTSAVCSFANGRTDASLISKLEELLVLFQDEDEVVEPILQTFTSIPWGTVVQEFVQAPPARLQPLSFDRPFESQRISKKIALQPSTLEVMTEICRRCLLPPAASSSSSALLDSTPCFVLSQTIANHILTILITLGMGMTLQAHRPPSIPLPRHLQEPAAAVPVTVNNGLQFGAPVAASVFPVAVPFGLPQPASSSPFAAPSPSPFTSGQPSVSQQPPSISAFNFAPPQPQAPATFFAVAPAASPSIVGGQPAVTPAPAFAFAPAKQQQQQQQHHHHHHHQKQPAGSFSFGQQPAQLFASTSPMLSELESVLAALASASTSSSSMIMEGEIGVQFQRANHRLLRIYVECAKSGFQQSNISKLLVPFYVDELAPSVTAKVLQSSAIFFLRFLLKNYQFGTMTADLTADFLGPLLRLLLSQSAHALKNDTTCAQVLDCLAQILHKVQRTPSHDDAVAEFAQGGGIEALVSLTANSSANLAILNDAVSVLTFVIYSQYTLLQEDPQRGHYFTAFINNAVLAPALDCFKVLFQSTLDQIASGLEHSCQGLSGGRHALDLRVSSFGVNRTALDLRVPSFGVNRTALWPELFAFSAETPPTRRLFSLLIAVSQVEAFGFDLLDVFIPELVRDHLPQLLRGFAKSSELTPQFGIGIANLSDPMLPSSSAQAAQDSALEIVLISVKYSLQQHLDSPAASVAILRTLFAVVKPFLQLCDRASKIQRVVEVLTETRSNGEALIRNGLVDILLDCFDGQSFKGLPLPPSIPTACKVLESALTTSSPSTIQSFFDAHRGVIENILSANVLWTNGLHSQIVPLLEVIARYASPTQSNSLFSMIMAGTNVLARYSRAILNPFIAAMRIPSLVADEKHSRLEAFGTPRIAQEIVLPNELLAQESMTEAEKEMEKERLRSVFQHMKVLHEAAFLQHVARFMQDKETPVNIYNESVPAVSHAMASLLRYVLANFKESNPLLVQVMAEQSGDSVRILHDIRCMCLSAFARMFKTRHFWVQPAEAIAIATFLMQELHFIAAVPSEAELVVQVITECARFNGSDSKLLTDNRVIDFLNSRLPSAAAAASHSLVSPESQQKICSIMEVFSRSMSICRDRLIECGVCDKALDYLASSSLQLPSSIAKSCLSFLEALVKASHGAVTRLLGTNLVPVVVGLLRNNQGDTRKLLQILCNFFRNGVQAELEDKKQESEELKDKCRALLRECDAVNVLDKSHHQTARDLLTLVRQDLQLL